MIIFLISLSLFRRKAKVVEELGEGFWFIMNINYKEEGRQIINIIKILKKVFSLND